MKQLYEFESIEDARAYTEGSLGKADGAEVMQKLAEYGVLREVYNLSTSEDSPVKDAALATVVTIESFENFDLSVTAVQDMLSLFTYNGVITQSQEDELKSLGVAVVVPYENTSQGSFNQSKGFITEIVAVSGNVIVELSAELPEACCVTFWSVREGFADINLGCPLHVKAASKYQHKVNTSKHQIVARLPFPDIALTVTTDEG